MNTVIPVENGDVLGALQAFFKELFAAGVVEALYTPMELKDGAIVPALVTDPALLGQANPLAPVMPINAARAVSALTGKKPPARLGAVLRPCEMRALYELVKLQQASLEGVVLIGFDCPGAYEVTDYAESLQNGRIGPLEPFAAAREGRDLELAGKPLRQACRICPAPIPASGAVHLQLLEAGADGGIPAWVEEELAAALGLKESAAGETPRQSAERLAARRNQARQQELAAMQARLASEGGLAELFATCIRCHNCMTACPICYCKTCLFRTSAFDHPPEHFLGAARRKGALRLLGDTLLFHLTRLNHMGASCVSCGLCTSACPNDIPVGMVFSAVSARLQAAFAYQPGKDLAETLPLVTFQPNEWTEIGEAK